MDKHILHAKMHIVEKLLAEMVEDEAKRTNLIQQVRDAVNEGRPPDVVVNLQPLILKTKAPAPGAA